MKHAPPQSFWDAAKHGAWLGLKWTTYIIGPLAVLMLIVFGGTLSYRVGRIGLGYLTFDRFAPAFFGPLGFYLSSCLWGCIGGIVISCIMYLSRRRLNLPRE